MYMTSGRLAGGASPLRPKPSLGNGMDEVQMDEVQGGRRPIGLARALVEWMQQLPRHVLHRQNPYIDEPRAGG
jgi:hypothetical protein